MSQAFKNCIKLTGNIPGSLFSNCSEINSFIAVFNNCINLTGTIPAELFANNIKVTSFNTTFSGCKNLTRKYTWQFIR